MCLFCCSNKGAEASEDATTIGDGHVSGKLFESLPDGADFERKLIKRGVTMEAFKVAKNNAATLDKIAQAIIGSPTFIPDEWVMNLLDAERAAHLAFFGQEFDLTLMRGTIERYGYARIAEWQKLGLEVHFLPSTVLMQNTSFDGWKIQPESWYWDQSRNGNLYHRQGDGTLVKVSGDLLPGSVVLIDTRKKPNYDDSKQMFAKDGDFMGRVIDCLRKDGKLARYQYGPQTSRFGISSIEWEDHLKAAVADHLGLEPTQVRLEMAIEANIIPQLYMNMPRKDDGTTGTWCWYEEFFKSASRRLIGGRSDGGGLARVDCGGSGSHWYDLAVRPLGVLA